MTMALEIHEYYKYLLGEVYVSPGPIVLPDGFTATALARIIHQTLVKKATMLEDVRHIQILYSAWAILNDSYIPIAAYSTSTQTDPPVAGPCLDSSTQTAAPANTRDWAVQTSDPPLPRSAGSQTAATAGLQTRNLASQTNGRPALSSCTVQAVQTDIAPASLRDGTDTAVQTDAVKLRTKWTQMRRRIVRATGSQTDPPSLSPTSPPPPPPPSSPPSPPPPPPPSSPPPPQVERHPAGTQTRSLSSRAVETQTLLPRALAGRRAISTQTPRLRPPWVVRLVRGAPPPPAERAPEPRRFHGRRLLRRGHDATPPEIPLTAAAPAPATAAAATATATAGGPAGSPSETLHADPRLFVGSVPGEHGGRRRTRVESDSGSIASPTGQSGRRSLSESSGGEADPTAPAPAPDSTPAPDLDPTLSSAAVEPAGTAPRLLVRPAPAASWASLQRGCPVWLPVEEPDDQKVPVSLNTSLTAVLDTSHSFLSAPPPELLGDSGAAMRPDASAAMRPVADNSASDMELDD